MDASRAPEYASERASQTQRDYMALEERLKQLSVNKLETIAFNVKQLTLINSPYRFNYFAGGHQIGKSYGGLGWITYHVTGNYPWWYSGIRRTGPQTFIILGQTTQSTRNVLCRKLFGMHGKYGTEILPGKDILEVKNMSGAMAGIIDYVRVRHRTDGVVDGESIIHVHSYSQGVEPIMGITADGILVDEEPEDQNIFRELMSRLFATGGLLNITATPLNGYSETYRTFAEDESGLYNLITYTINDASHMTEERRAEVIATAQSYPDKSARLYGVPTVGEYAIYNFEWDDLVVEDFEIPDHWPQGIGLDFPHTTGTFAAVRMAMNPESQRVFVTAAYKAKNRPAVFHASNTLDMGGKDVTCFWPQDGTRQDGEESIRDMYERHGLRLHSDWSHYELESGGKTKSTGAVIAECTNLMAKGKLKVFGSAAPELMKEIKTYQQKDGRVAKHQDDHMIDAMHKGVMMRRFWTPPGENDKLVHLPSPRRFNFYGTKRRANHKTGPNKWRR